VPVINNGFSLKIPELPVYVELPRGANLDVVPLNWGENLALVSGVTATASGSPVHPGGANIPNSITKMHNGFLENWYWNQTNDGHPWMSNNADWPATVSLAFPVPTTISRVVIYCPTPWQWDGSLLDYELQYFNTAQNQFVTIDHVVEPTVTFNMSTPLERCSVQSFYSDRSHFIHQFPPQTTTQIRIVVHEVTWGGGATHDVVVAGGQTGPHQICLREIEVYR